ncbi:hypothetical protein BT96DRAFT_979055 [Gymnopus androsaceus JB14]|uniref:Uncharacterized protein n=1 Tax=Gymnopus androsaceus JB14 TaxID=1447944 RepID=A0A6A4H757_9AGAR|nr:hypothetical protein BT96DRAFT_979055 [Gymnopus androsaceus JB14]
MSEICPCICFHVFSLLAIVVLDVSKPFMNPFVASIANAALIVYIPSSVGVSLWLLHRTMLGQGAMLPSSNTNDTRTRGQLGTALAFVHAWLMLSRFLGAISESSSSALSNPNSTSAASQWAPVGLPFTLLFIVIFGECLLVLGIHEEKWGYFLRPYRTIIFILQTVFDILSAGQVAVENFRRQRENAG